MAELNINKVFTVDIHFQIRSKWQRLKRMPKLMCFTWKFTAKAPVIDRIKFCIYTFKIVMR